MGVQVKMRFPEVLEKYFQQIGGSRQTGGLPLEALPTVPYAALSYSLGGEDMLLAKIFKRHILSGTPGVYVDVGAGSPLQGSNSYIFYARGWRGVCVDPNPTVAPDWSKFRPRDKFICTAVAERGSETKWYQHKLNFGMSRIGDAPDDLLEYHPAHTVPVQRLDALLDAHLGNTDIQFMTIDVEDSELGVLASNDWDRYRPEVILMECRNFSFDAPHESPSVRLLADRGYRLTGRVAENVVMARN